MIALHENIKNDDYTLDTKKSITSSTNLPKVKSAKSAVLALGNAARGLWYSGTNKLYHANAMREERKHDKLALERLLQLDDALLKDMGIERRDLEAVKSGALTLDALNKFGIVAARDNSSNTNFIWK